MRRSKDLFSSEFLRPSPANDNGWAVCLTYSLNCCCRNPFLKLGHCDNILLVFHKQKLQTATEMNLSRQTESSASSLTSRICSSQPYSNVFQEFAIISYYCHQCFSEDTLGFLNGISGSNWQRSACRVFSTPSHLEHLRLQYIKFFMNTSPEIQIDLTVFHCSRNFVH